MTVPVPEALGPTEVAGLFGPGASSASQQAAQDKEMFLNLMVAQLRYQDPMNPADMGQFMAQNAQMQALEKMQEVADATTALMTQQMAFGAAGLVGREVTWPGADGQLLRGTVGAVSFSADGPVLDVEGHSISINQVQAVGTPDPIRGSSGPVASGPDPTAAPAAGQPADPTANPTANQGGTSARDTTVRTDPGAAVVTDAPDTPADAVTGVIL
ncbi:hypothetical protein KLP28_14295 [Nocardioidaceae bacterium]|nr:hypothetical protein KLP28_14295 [Nocardioidaceae bacterium]